MIALWDAINSAAGLSEPYVPSVVVHIARFLRSSDSVVSYTGVSTDMPNNFGLQAGEGYRIQVNDLIDDYTPGTNDFTWQIKGSEVPSFAVELLAAASGVSATGLNDYCPPYNRIAGDAADLMREINDYGCPGGTCPFGTCSMAGTPCETAAADCPENETCDALTERECTGGSNDGNDCERAFMTVSRFLSSSDTLTTYAGVETDDQPFDITSGESYRLQVASDVDYIPKVFSVDVIVESNPPAPCGGFFTDGGYLYLRNSEGHTRVTWWGGGTEADTGPPYRNLVFKPSQGPAFCSDGTPDCAQNCPGPHKPESCDWIQGCFVCGCEIQDGLEGYCESTTTYTRCTDDTDCGTGTCRLLGHLDPNEVAAAVCDQVQCNNTGTCSDERWEAGRNCCDQHWADGDLTDPRCHNTSDVRCTVLDQPAAVTFQLESVSLDDGTTWFDPSVRGVENELSFKHRNYCEFVCDGGDNECDSCDNDSNCPGGECVSSSIGRCSEDEEQSCTFTDDCLGSGICLGVCE